METVIRTCAKCGVDVTHAKRFKDASGRFFCEACAAKAKAKPAEKSASPAPVAAAVQQPDDGTIALADEPPPRAAGGARRGELQICPDCGTPLGSGPICASCGYDRITGRTIGERGQGTPPPAGTLMADKPKHLPRPCKKCGYDLTGLKTAKCPECGTINPGRLRHRETEKQTLRKMYIQPLIMTAIGMAVAVVAYAIIGSLSGGATSGVGGVVAYLIYFALSLPLGFITYVVCSMIFIGFDEPLGVTLVRLAAVYAVTDACAAILSGIPFVSWITWPLQAAVYLGLLMQIMELDWEDAWLVAAVTFIVHAILGAAIYWVIMTYL